MGVRILSRDGEDFRNIVTLSMKRVCQITDPVYIEELRPLYVKIFIASLTKPLENIKSRFRSDLTNIIGKEASRVAQSLMRSCC